MFDSKGPIQKSDFNTGYIKRKSLNWPENVADNDDMCQQSWNISSLADILVPPLNFWKDLRTTA